MQTRGLSRYVARSRQTKRFRKCTVLQPYFTCQKTNSGCRFFNSLGVLPDFSDSLVEYAYDRQANCDPDLQAYYLECLQVITESRYSEQLQMKVATPQSQHIVSRRDLTAAYRFLNISPAESKLISDAQVIERYQAQQPDLSAHTQQEAREHLYKIAVSRNSPLLMNASRQSVETYDDALSWLGNGVNKDTPDEGILAVLAIKVSRAFLTRLPYLTFVSDCGKQGQRRDRPKSNRRYRQSPQEQPPQQFPPHWSPGRIHHECRRSFASFEH